MKTAVILLMLFLASLGSYAADPLTFTGVVQAEGVPKEELFARAQAWFATTFKCGKCVIQTSDKESGQIIGRGAFQYTSATFLSSAVIKGWVTYTVKVFLKDARYKYEITDFIHEGSAASDFIAGVPMTSPPFSFGPITSDENYPPIKHCTKGVCGKNWAKLKSDSESQANILIAALAKAMAAPASGTTAW